MGILGNPAGLLSIPDDAELCVCKGRALAQQKCVPAAPPWRGPRRGPGCLAGWAWLAMALLGEEQALSPLLCFFILFFLQQQAAPGSLASPGRTLMATLVLSLVVTPDPTSV